MSLDARNITFSYKNKTVLKDFSLSLEKGDFTMLLGANGSGKSTALRILSGFISPNAGNILLDDVPLNSMKHFERARKIAVVSQALPPILDFTVSEMVMLGRLGQTPRLAPRDVNDTNAVKNAMDKMEIISLANRPVSQLSGGERQRVMLAQALACQSNYLLLDEPTSALDPEHIFLLMRTLQENCSKTGILMVCHDLNLAWKYAQKVIILKDSGIFLEGNTREILTPENILHAFGCDAVIQENEGIILKEHVSSCTTAIL